MNFKYIWYEHHATRGTCSSLAIMVIYELYTLRQHYRYLIYAPEFLCRNRC